MYTQPKKTVNPLPLFLVAILGGLVLGAISAVIYNFFWLIIIFPLIIGTVGALLLYKVIRVRKIRSTIFAFLAGLIMALACIGALHYGVYWNEMRQIRAEIAAEAPEMSTDAINQHIDTVFEQQTGSNGLIGYMKLRAEEGTTIRFRRASIPIKGAWFWGMLIIEAGLIAGLMIILPITSANAAFCPTCDEWYREGRRIATAPLEATKALKQSVPTGNFREILGHTSQGQGLPCLVISLARCDTSPDHPAHLIVERVKQDRKGNRSETTIVKGLVDGAMVAQYMSEQAPLNPAVPTNA